MRDGFHQDIPVLPGGRLRDFLRAEKRNGKGILPLLRFRELNEPGYYEEGDELSAVMKL